MRITVVERDSAPVPPDLALPERLRASVEAFAHPRHAEAEPEGNRRARDAMAARLEAAGYRVSLEGAHDNVLALPREPAGPLTLVGAHYDSVPGTPGADDNASAVAVLLELAERLPSGRIAYAGFNREEDGLLGSRELAPRVEQLLTAPLRTVHVLEMLGFTDRRPDSQRAPLPLPGLPTVGDFIAVVANHPSGAELRRVLGVARECPGEPRVVGLEVPMGMLSAMPDVLRSDHAPFWLAGRCALMWTDTSEFRNPHYHQPSDTPDTLDFAFLAGVTRLLMAVLADAPGAG